MRRPMVGRFWGEGRQCPSPSTVRGDWLDAYVTERFLAQLGDWELTHTRVIPGYDPQPEIEETAEEYRLHADQPVPKSEIARRIWREKGDALDARSNPTTPPAMQEMRPTHITDG